MRRKMTAMRLRWLAAAGLSGLAVLASVAAPAPSQWQQPAAALAEQIAGILGPGEARLTIRNLSSIPTEEIPAIRRLLEQDLKDHGIVASGAESANAIRVTLSENVRERLWVAEVAQGNETRVAMVRVEPGVAQMPQAGSGLALRKQPVLTSRDPVLAALETADGLVVVEPEEIVIFGHAAGGWQEQKRVGIGQKKPLARDPRAVIVPSASADGFEAFIPGIECKGGYQPAQPAGEWTIRCRESDDPWTIAQFSSGIVSPDSSPTLKAFYNMTRNYFTGVVAPSVEADLPPFYTAAVVPRPDGAGLLINGIDGKVQLAERGAIKAVSGTRDWGSDFAALRTGCGAGTQIVASGSGEAATDSLRAYELPGQEALPASAPLTMDGTVTALWTAPDGKSLLAVVRTAADEFEVDRVTASCN
jgi:hypothetical protein